METKTSNNFNYLSHYLTTKEFDFINNLNFGNEKYDDIVQRESKTRDIIVNLINNINDSISDNSEPKEITIPILIKSQNVFESINSNIKLAQALKDTSSKISNSIVELLIKIESNPNDSSNVSKSLEK